MLWKLPRHRNLEPVTKMGRTTAGACFNRLRSDAPIALSSLTDLLKIIMHVDVEVFRGPTPPERHVQGCKAAVAPP